MGGFICIYAHYNVLVLVHFVLDEFLEVNNCLGSWVVLVDAFFEFNEELMFVIRIFSQISVSGINSIYVD